MSVPRSPSAPARPSWRRPVLQFVAVGLVTAGVLALVTGWFSRQAAWDEALQDAQATTRLLGRSVVKPAISAELLSGDPAAINRFDWVIDHRVRRGAVLRVKLWDGDPAPDRPAARRAGRHPHVVLGPGPDRRGARRWRGRLPAQGREPEELLAGVRAAARGESPLHPRAARELLSARARHQRGAAPAPVGTKVAAELTPREVEVLTLVRMGLANKQIARRLGISERTVKAHLTSTFHRIGVADRTQAALWAERNDVG